MARDLDSQSLELRAQGEGVVRFLLLDLHLRLKQRTRHAQAVLVFEPQRLERIRRGSLGGARAVRGALALELVSFADRDLLGDHADAHFDAVDHLGRRDHLAALELQLRLLLGHVGLALCFAHLERRLLGVHSAELILARLALRLNIRLDMRLAQLEVFEARGRRAVPGAHDRLHLLEQRLARRLAGCRLRRQLEGCVEVRLLGRDTGRAERRRRRAREHALLHRLELRCRLDVQIESRVHERCP